MKRRTFFQRFGSILAVLGIAEAEWLTLGNHYSQALADRNARKFALLVGINKYQGNPQLHGCLTDVELQRELLIHRFGFQPSDIVSLTDEPATREYIENAFLEHLVKGARPGDVVVFHFSGYGSRVQSGTLQETIQNAFVPSDGDALSSQDNKIVNYLLEETLLVMLRSLPTERVISVLDTSFYTPANVLPIGLRSRARSMEPKAMLAAAELEFQIQLQTQLQNQLASKNLLKNQNSEPRILAATSSSQELAREIQLSGVSAGLFTYALTQYLWETTPATTIQVSLSRVASSIQQLGIGQQQPALLRDPNNQLSQMQLAEIFLWDFTNNAHGVVTAIEAEGKTVQLWLAGLPLQVLEYYGANSRLTLVSQEGLTAQLVLRSRTGLTAKAQLSSPNDTTTLEVGQLVQETVRVLPRSVNLTIALDAGLDRIERVDATSAFATVPYVSIGEQAADYVFAKLPEANVLSPSRYGLFSLGGELVPNASAEAGEPVKVAVKQLAPRLQTLLAAKIWRLTENEGSSRLKLKVVLETIDRFSPQKLIQRETFLTQQAEQLVSSGKSKRLSSISTQGLPSIPAGSHIHYRMENLSDRPLYLMLLGLNSSKTAIGLCPWVKTTAQESKSQLQDLVIAPGQILTVPPADNGFEWVVQGASALNETQLLFSTAPFTQTQRALEAAKHPTAERSCIQPLMNPLEVTKAVLRDLHNASAVTEMNSPTADSWNLDVSNWASLSFIYQVI